MNVDQPKLTRRQREVLEDLYTNYSPATPAQSLLFDQNERRIISQLVKLGLVERGTSDQGDHRCRCYYVEGPVKRRITGWGYE